eukprot:2647097-Rhodomonas_salina.2
MHTRTPDSSLCSRPAPQTKGRTDLSPLAPTPAPPPLCSRHALSQCHAHRVARASADSAIRSPITHLHLHEPSPGVGGGRSAIASREPFGAKAPPGAPPVAAEIAARARAVSVWKARQLPLDQVAHSTLARGGRALACVRAPLHAIPPMRTARGPAPTTHTHTHTHTHTQHWTSARASRIKTPNTTDVSPE